MFPIERVPSHAPASNPFSACSISRKTTATTQRDGSFFNCFEPNEFDIRFLKQLQRRHEMLSPLGLVDVRSLRDKLPNSCLNYRPSTVHARKPRQVHRAPLQGHAHPRRFVNRISLCVFRPEILCWAVMAAWSIVFDTTRESVIAYGAHSPAGIYDYASDFPRAILTPLPDERRQLNESSVPRIKLPFCATGHVQYCRNQRSVTDRASFVTGGCSASV